MKNTKAIFSLGMTASEVVSKIVEANPCIGTLLFKAYIPTKNLEEGSVIQIQASLAKMIHHNLPEKEEKIWLQRKEITSEHLSQIIKRLGQKRVLAVTSNLKLSNTKKKFHIPMMDFSCEVSSGALKRIQEFLRKIKQRGVVLYSGRSYHYYGSELLSERDWLVFLGNCLLFSGYADSRYVGHRLIDGYTSLRISKGKIRPKVPKVVAIV